ARDRAADFANARGFLKLAGRLLEAQVELLFLQRGDLSGEAGGILVANALDVVLGGFHQRPSIRATILVFTESFAAPRRSDSRATASGTPSISNMMRPGATRAAQNSGAPLPLPIRTSIGFFETGTSGKIRIHTRPWRFISRVIARRAASISRALTRFGSSAFRPNCPKFSEAPAFVLPLMRPLKARRNLGFFGCI